MSRPGPSRSPADRSLWRDPNLRILFAVTLMAVLGVVSVAPAFPDLARTLELTPQAVGRLITVFTLPGIFLTPVLGVLADRWGRKRVLVPALVVFALAGGACALARDFTVLLVLRFLQGVGAAALGSLNVTLVGDLFEGHERTAAMGYNGAVLSIGTALYPAVGGLLATFGWHFPFALPLLALPVAAAVLFALDEPEPGRWVPLGTYLVDVARRLADRRVGVLLLTSTVTFVILYGPYLTYLPFHLAERFGARPWTIGAVFAASSTATAVASSRLGWITHRVSARRLILLAFLGYGLALAIIPRLPHLPLLLLPALLFGAAMGINVPSLMTLLANAAPSENRGAFMAVNGMVLRLGQTVGPLGAGAVFGVWGTPGTFLAGAGVALGMLLLLAWVLS